MGREPAREPRHPLRGDLLRQAALTIRSLDSSLEGISYQARPAGPVLVYTFALAGREEAFAVALEPVMLSLADLYPAAAPLEAELARRHGVVFRRHEEVG